MKYCSDVSNALNKTNLPIILNKFLLFLIYFLFFIIVATSFVCLASVVYFSYLGFFGKENPGWCGYNFYKYLGLSQEYNLILAFITTLFALFIWKKRKGIFISLVIGVFIAIKCVQEKNLDINIYSLSDEILIYGVIFVITICITYIGFPHFVLKPDPNISPVLAQPIKCYEGKEEHKSELDKYRSYSKNHQ